MTISLLQQLKQRQLALQLKQSDMMLRAESKGNPRLNTLALLAKDLNCELMLIPEEKLSAVQQILEEQKKVSDDPWQGLLGEDE